MKLILTGLIENISTRNDGTIKFTFGCNELDASQAGNLFQLRGKYSKCLLSDSNITEMETKLIDEQSVNNESKVKKPSQRLRATLYRVWEQSKSEHDFDTYYLQQMEVLINHFKGKLDAYNIFTRY